MGLAISNINMAGPAISGISAPSSASGSGPPQQDPSASASPGSSGVSTEAAKQLAQEIQRQMESMNISLSFSTYGKNGEDISVIVTDKVSGKVIREIPPKEIQDLHTKMGELIGLIFNHSV